MASRVKITPELLRTIPRKCRKAFLLNLPYQEFVSLCSAARMIYETDSTDCLAWKTLANDSGLYAAMHVGDFGLPTGAGVPHPASSECHTGGLALPRRPIAEWMGSYVPKCMEALFGHDDHHSAGQRFFSVLLTNDDPVYDLGWWEKILVSGIPIVGLTRLKPYWKGHNQLHFSSEQCDRLAGDVSPCVRVNYGNFNPRARLLLFSAPAGIEDHAEVFSGDLTVIADSGPFPWNRYINISSSRTTSDTVSLDVPLGEMPSIALRISLSASKLSEHNHNWTQHSIDLLDPSRLRLDRLVCRVAGRLRCVSQPGVPRELSPDTLEAFQADIRALKQRVTAHGRTCSDIRGNSEFPLEITLYRSDQNGLPEAVLDGLLSEEFAVDPRPTSFVAARLHPDIDPTREMQLCWHAGSCVLSSYLTGRRVCEHSMPYPVLVQWIQTSRGLHEHMCPECNRLGKRLSDMQTMTEICLDNLCEDSKDLKTNSMRRYLELSYGRNFVVIEWQGCNQLDVTVHLYLFGHVEEVRGFVHRIEGDSDSDSDSDSDNNSSTIAASPDATKMSCYMVNGMERADREQSLWSLKFPHLVMYSTSEN